MFFSQYFYSLYLRSFPFSILTGTLPYQSTSKVNLTFWLMKVAYKLYAESKSNTRRYVVGTFHSSRSSKGIRVERLLLWLWVPPIQLRHRLRYGSYVRNFEKVPKWNVPQGEHLHHWEVVPRVQYATPRMSATNLMIWLEVNEGVICLFFLRSKKIFFPTWTIYLHGNFVEGNGTVCWSNVKVSERIHLWDLRCDVKSYASSSIQKNFSGTPLGLFGGVYP